MTAVIGGQNLILHFSRTVILVQNASGRGEIKIHSKTLIMEFKTTNVNYSARVVQINNPYALNGLDNLVGYQILGSQVLVSKQTQPGELGLYFPVECALSQEFCKANNLYRDKTLNSDVTKTGFFEPTGRVKALKLKSNISEGIFLPLTSLSYLGINTTALKPGTEFTHINNNEICRKYIPQQFSINTNIKTSTQKRSRSYNDQQLQNFSFHIDTPQIKRNLHLFEEPQKVSITRKYHGTSAVFAHIPCPRQLSLFERLLIKLGIKIQTNEYRYIWSSRKVIKGSVLANDSANYSHINTTGFYGNEDIWTIVFNEIKYKIPPGFTIYGEIIGRLPSGKEIQKDYSYNLTGHKLKVYRITFVNAAGHITELSYDGIVAFCIANELDYVEGKSYYLVNLNDNLVNLLQAEVEAISGLSIDKLPADVPEEGVVVRLEHSAKFKVFKYKQFAFLERETKQLDSGTENIEEENC